MITWLVITKNYDLASQIFITSKIQFNITIAYTLLKEVAISRVITGERKILLKSISLDLQNSADYIYLHYLPQSEHKLL